MKQLNTRILACMSIAMVAMDTSAAADQVWTFDRTGDREKWTVPSELTGAVMGGSMWLTPSPRIKDPAELSSLNYQIFGEFNAVRRILQGEKIRKDGPSNAGELSTLGPATRDMTSSQGLGLEWPTTGHLYLQLRVLNLSPATDLLIRSRAAVDPAGTWRSKRCAIKPDTKVWQDLSCVIPAAPESQVEQIALGISENVIRGDIWIDSVRIEAGPPRAAPPRPDLVSPSIVPRVNIPGVSQERFADAFSVLSENIVSEVPTYGFSYPYQKASAAQAYGDLPWPGVDTAINAAASAWSNQTFAENVFRGIQETQALNPDGRISGYIYEAVAGQPGDATQRPDFFFSTAYRMAMRSKDPGFRAMLLDMMERYLGWYTSGPKRNAPTGLITGDYEEAHGESPTWNDRSFNPQPQMRAPILLNSAVVLAAEKTALLADTLDRADAAARYRRLAEEIKAAVNRHLWDESQGFYFDLILPTMSLTKQDSPSRPDGGRQAAAFFTLGSIAPPDRAERLLRRLLSPEFNWGKGGVSSASLQGTTGKEDLSRWLAIWMQTNVLIVERLEQAGRDHLAAEINWAFIKTIRAQYNELYSPDGRPLGGERFGFTAAAMVDGVLAHLFGVQFDGAAETILVAPKIPRELMGKRLQIDNIVLPWSPNSRLSIEIEQQTQRSGTVEIRLDGPLPRGPVTVKLPGSRNVIVTPAVRRYRANFPST